MWPRIRLGIAFALLAAWLAFLASQAFWSARFPVVSHAQLLNSESEVVADVDVGDSGKPKSEVGLQAVLWSKDPKLVPGSLTVVNLPEVAGFAGKGRYVLLLKNEAGAYKVAGLPRSPGLEYVADGQRPLIYPDVPAVRQQIEQWRKRAK